MQSLQAYLQQQLDKREAQQQLRRLRLNPSLADFCSNDYLGLARSEELQSRVQRRRPTSLGSTGSRLLSGNTALCEGMEKELAAFHRAEAGLIFNSGYSANLGLMSCIAGRQDTLLFDRLVHNSIRTGIRLSRARALGFAHNDVQDLAAKLKRVEGRKIVVVESLYSMNGDKAPLLEVVEVVRRHGAVLIVDEAHATGVYGPGGEGLVVAEGLEEEVFARIHTFGKAMACQGAIVLGPEVLRAYLINFSAPFIYTTALPESSLWTVKEAYSYLKEKPELIGQLTQNIHYFRSCLNREAQEVLPDNDGPIQYIAVPGKAAVKQLAQRLRQRGYDVRPILPPTVPPGEERIRICLHAFNSEEEMAGLATAINELLPSILPIKEQL
ncbi:MAG: 8-amino-7-oxononanoate synthase [Bacteroidota bacterium]